MTRHPPIRLPARPAAALALMIALAAPAALAKAPPADPTWRPEVSERLVKLPATYLKKSLDRDFAKSGLGLAIQDLDDEIGFKSRTLGDLHGAIGKADGEVRTELRHQLLAEKRAYLEMVSRKHALRRRHVVAKKRVLEGLMARIGRDAASMTPARDASASRPRCRRSTSSCWRPRQRPRAAIRANTART